MRGKCFSLIIEILVNCVTFQIKHIHMQNNIYSFDGHQEQHCFKSIGLGKGDTGTIIKAVRVLSIFSLRKRGNE